MYCSIGQGSFLTLPFVGTEAWLHLGHLRAASDGWIIRLANMMMCVLSKNDENEILHKLIRPLITIRDLPGSQTAKWLLLEH